MIPQPRPPVCVAVGLEDGPHEDCRPSSPYAGFGNIARDTFPHDGRDAFLEVVQPPEADHRLGFSGPVAPLGPQDGIERDICLPRRVEGRWLAEEDAREAAFDQLEIEKLGEAWLSKRRSILRRRVPKVLIASFLSWARRSQAGGARVFQVSRRGRNAGRDASPLRAAEIRYAHPDRYARSVKRSDGPLQGCSDYQEVDVLPADASNLGLTKVFFEADHSRS
jgi:hypothetical protein